jgi:hypothetical protein
MQWATVENWGLVLKVPRDAARCLVKKQDVNLCNWDHEVGGIDKSSFGEMARGQFI